MSLLTRWISVLLLAACVPLAAVAQSFPSKVVRLVVPFPPGGVVDITARLLAEELTRTLGGTVIVENKPGAGGTIGAEYVARAAPDGHTILLGGAATHAFAPWVYKDLRYDPVKDFVAVTQLTSGPLALTVPASSKITTVSQFVDDLKARGNEINYASNGNGTFPHLSVELLSQALKVKPLHVPYPGGAQAMTAILGGQVQFTQNHIPVVKGHVESGRVRVLATTGATRSKTFPDVPTLKEAGLDVEATAWFGLFVPAKTPADLVVRLYKAVADAAAAPALQAKLALQGDEVIVQGPAIFRDFQAAEMAKWKKVIADGALK
jgi:tripartite-type tricarboxylate transporter receptor subunit TctC